MSWHDDHSSGSPAEGQQGYRPRSTGSPARRARRNDGYFYENDEDYRDDKSCSTDYVRSDDSNNSRIGGGSSARSDKIIDDGAYSASGDGSSCDWGSEETGGVGREDHGDAVVLRSLEEAISKSSATRRRPSTAHIDTLERSAMMKARMFGHQSSATRKAFRDTIVACNSLAMLSLGRGDPARCRDLLARALDLASDANITAGEDRRGGGALGRDPADVDPALQVLTLNNTACLHRRPTNHYTLILTQGNISNQDQMWLGEPKRALRCLRRAAQVGRQSSGSEHLEVTHLNACAVLSELGRHEEALEHARSAVFYGQEREEAGSQRGRGGGWNGGGERLRGTGTRRARLATLAVSYYNLAVELEYTRRYQACLRWYNEAVKLARDPDVQNEALIQTFQRSYAGARKKHAPHLLRRSGETKDPSAGNRAPNRFPVPATAPTGRYASASKENDVRGSEADGGDLRRAERPNFGRVKRQRAGDDRRSRTTDRNTNGSMIAKVNGAEARVTSSAASSNGVFRSDAELQQQRVSSSREERAGLNQQHLSSALGQQERVAVQAARNRPTERSNDYTAARIRSRPVSGGGSGGGRSSEGQKTNLQRKRPASAEISRDRIFEGRAYRQDVEKIPTISEVANLPVVEPKWQQLGRSGCVEAPADNSRLEIGVGVATDCGLRRRPPHSRRPMSAHSRLEEGGWPRDSTIVSGVGRNGGGGDGGDDNNSRTSRIRSSTERVLRESASQPMPPIVCGDAGVWSQPPGHGNSSVWNQSEQGRKSSNSKDGSETVSPEGPEMERMGGSRCRFKATTTAVGQPRPGEDRAVAANCAPSGQRRIRFSSSAPASDIKRRERTSVTELGAQRASDSPTTLLRRAGRVVAERRQEENSRGVASGTVSRENALPSPQEVVDVTAVTKRTEEDSRVVDSGIFSRENVSPSPEKVTSASVEQIESPRESILDNGRDGKLYLNSWPGEQLLCGSGLLGSEAREHRVDNGRDGKFYLDFETDEQRCGLTNNSRDETGSREETGVREEAGKGADHTCKVEAVEAVKEEVAGNKTGVAVTTGRTEFSAGRSVLQRAEAASAIRKAAVVAALRRRSARNRVDGELRRIFLDATGTGGEKSEESRGASLEKGSSRRASLEIASGSATIDHDVSTVTGFDDAKEVNEECPQPSAASPAEGLEAGHFNLAVENEFKLGRTTVDRRTLAASAIRVWIARACLTRRLQRRLTRDLHLRWEPEIHRIAATRIQSVARAAACRRWFTRMGRAAVSIQRVVRGWRARSAAREHCGDDTDDTLLLSRPEGDRAACEKIQRLFRDYRGRQQAIKKRQIAWEETVVHHSAAGVIKSCWHRYRSRRPPPLAPQQQQQQISRASTLSAAATTTAERTAYSSASDSFDPRSNKPLSRLVTATAQEADDSTATTASSRTPAAYQNPTQPQLTHLWRGAQAGASIYALWGAFMSLLTAAATRRAVRRSIATTLLGPAATTFAVFNRDRRTAAIAAAAAVVYPFSASPPMTASYQDPKKFDYATASSCDPAIFDSARCFKRKVDAASRRMEGVMCARTASLSIVEATVTGFVRDSVDGGGISGGGIGGGGGGGCAKDSAASVETRRRIEEAAQAEAGSIVLQAVEDCWDLLSSRYSSPVGLKDERVSQALTEILSGTLQDLIDDLCGALLPPHQGVQTPPPVALLRTLASSAAVSLLSHPDFSDAFTSSHEDGGGFSHVDGGDFSHEDGGVFSEAFRADESDDYSRLVAEVYSCCLLVPQQFSKNSGSGGEGFSSEHEANDQHKTDRIDRHEAGRFSSEHETNDQHKTDRIDRHETGGFSSEHETYDQHKTGLIGQDDTDQNGSITFDTGTEPSTPVVVQPSSPLSLPPACYLRAKERSQLLRSVAQLIDDTAEELLCGMQKEPPHPVHKNHQQGRHIDGGRFRESREPPSSSRTPLRSRGACYDDALRQMTKGLWDLACDVSAPIDAIEEEVPMHAVAEEDRAALLCTETAALAVQGWARRQWARRRTRISSS